MRRNRPRECAEAAGRFFLSELFHSVPFVSGGWNTSPVTRARGSQPFIIGAYRRAGTAQSAGGGHGGNGGKIGCALRYAPVKHRRYSALIELSGPSSPNSDSRIREARIHHLIRKAGVKDCFRGRDGAPCRGWIPVCAGMTEVRDLGKLGSCQFRRIWYILGRLDFTYGGGGQDKIPVVRSRLPGHTAGFCPGLLRAMDIAPDGPGQGCTPDRLRRRLRHRFVRHKQEAEAQSADRPGAPVGVFPGEFPGASRLASGPGNRGGGWRRPAVWRPRRSTTGDRPVIARRPQRAARGVACPDQGGLAGARLHRRRQSFGISESISRR